MATLRHRFARHARTCAAFVFFSGCASQSDLDDTELVEGVQQRVAALSVAAPADPTASQTGPRVVDTALSGAAQGAATSGEEFGLTADVVEDGLVPPSCGPDEPIGCAQKASSTQCCAENDQGVCVKEQTCRWLVQLCKNISSDGTPNYYPAAGDKECGMCHDKVATPAVVVDTWN